MERGNDRSGPRLDDEFKAESESLERSGRESRVEEHREQQGATEEEPEAAERIAGSGSSAETYPYTNRGEEGGASHPKPREES